MPIFREGSVDGIKKTNTSTRRTVSWKIMENCTNSGIRQLLLQPVYTLPLIKIFSSFPVTKFTQDRLRVQIDTVPSCNMAFLTTRTGLPTVNIHLSHFTHVGDFNY